MKAETIAPTLYRTGRGDRSIPLILALCMAVSVPVLVWSTGPFLWPGGAAAALAVGLGSLGSFYRWRKATGSVFCSDTERILEFRQGRRKKVVSWDALTRVDVRPSSVRTKLWAGRSRYRLSHRLVRADDLLDRLRRGRPDLFSPPTDVLVFRRSTTSVWLQLLLAAGTYAAGLLAAEWQLWLSWIFEGSAAYILLRIGFFIPRAYRVTAGRLTTYYWFRWKRWKRPDSVREGAYAAGGAVFFRMVLHYGRWRVVLDEGQLLDAVRPRAGHIVHLLMGARSAT